MRKFLIIIMLFFWTSSFAQVRIANLPVWDETAELTSKQDWMIIKNTSRAEVYRSSDSKDIIINNGLVKRSFRVQPNLACIDFSNLTTGEQLLRAVGPEAKISIDGKNYNVGGLYGQKEKAYLKREWIDNFKGDLSDFQFESYITTTIIPYVKWRPSHTSQAVRQVQPAGKMVTFIFSSQVPELKNVKVEVHYELYDGIPALCKWISILNNSNRQIKLNKVSNEILAVHEEESSVAGSTAQMRTPHGIYVESNYAFNDSMNARLSDQTTHWKADSTYTSQVSYELNTPCLLEVYPPVGPGVQLSPGKTFNSIRTNELLLDSYDRERNGMAQRLMYRTIAPWITENPIFMHLISNKPDKVKVAVDQCVETGYEGIILSFGSGINLEDTAEKNIRAIKELVDYAHSKGILLGGYTLFSSRRINDEEDVIDPKTGKADVHAAFAKAPCLGSKWGLNYIKSLKEVITRTGLDILEYDGPYPGDVCASVKHPGHKGLDDSQWSQMELQKEFYRWCNEKGVYVNAPDWYFMDGTNKIALGYREVNFSLPREQQIILNRQNIYDGTWEKTPSMSWGFVPLTEYHGGGAAATLEPLSEHLHAYRQLMMQYYGAGIQACYRGPRLYDTDETKRTVKDVISWYKKYRTVLNSEIVHLRRADGRDWDGILHVHPAGKEKGLAMLYNPTSEMITRKIVLPLYYSGLKKNAFIREMDGKAKRYTLDPNGKATLTVKIPANGNTWLVIE
ncbi:MAG: alpha-galactosidase [Pedobacter sp.]|uniref:alpha-galactosidase n=1 Tax=Pedobacter sp. TaxID=1411316 RepID=UPI00339B14A9